MELSKELFQTRSILREGKLVEQERYRFMVPTNGEWSGMTFRWSEWRDMPIVDERAGETKELLG